MGEHFFTTYVRTKNVFKHRFKDMKDYKTVKIYVYELKKLGVNSGPLLYSLREDGQIWYDNKGNFKALVEGEIDPALLRVTEKIKKVIVPLTKLHLWMRDHLLHVDIDRGLDLSVYFKAFLKHRSEGLGPFFTVDSFSGRVHTPVVNIKGDFRKHLRLYGEPVVSLDVKQMQPVILAKICKERVGKNPFSDAIDRGDDVYEHLKKSCKLETRDEAKIFLFKLIFGKPMNEIGGAFEGDTAWVDWINSYKSEEEVRNPHKRDRHTNLAWLLQSTEVRAMTDVWEGLMGKNIPFLTIHDEIFCREGDRDGVYRVMREKLAKHFDRFEVIVGGK